MIERDQIFINGEWVPSAGVDVIEVINPVTEEPVATIPAGTAGDVDLAAKAPADCISRVHSQPNAEFNHSGGIHDRAAADLYQRRMGRSLER